ncbi:hypothetical protein DRN74_06710, partial [Candidatus Micrarchaeota archaeon]
RREVQENGHVRYWVSIPEAGKYLRVVTEPDGETVHNAFFDQRFKPGREVRECSSITIRRLTCSTSASGVGPA